MAFFFYDFQYCYMKSFFAIIMSSFAIYATMKKVYAGKNDFCQVRIWGPAILLLFYELGQDIGNGGYLSCPKTNPPLSYCCTSPMFNGRMVSIPIV